MARKSGTSVPRLSVIRGLKAIRRPSRLSRVGNTTSEKRRLSKARNSEVDAYVFIKENLKLLGWDIRNPARNPGGQVYTQNECLSHEALKDALGLDRPENVVKVSESIQWIIEAKRDHKQLDLAVVEAEDYAKRINDKGVLKAVFVSGVAGNLTDSYVIRTKFFVDGKFVPIRFNGKDISSLISPDVAKLVLEAGPDISDVPVDEQLFLSKAERVNQILHLGAINKNDRAKVMAALLLSLVDDTRPNIDATPTVLIKDNQCKGGRGSQAAQQGGVLRICASFVARGERQPHQVQGGASSDDPGARKSQHSFRDELGH